MKSSAFDLVTDALAAWRLTRLVTEDTITDPVREKVFEKFGNPDQSNTTSLSYLVTCPHCTGMWVAGGVVLARLIAPRAWRHVSHALAVAAVVSIYAETRS